MFVPFIGTTLGAAVVLFFKKDHLDERLEKTLLGFASGIMMAVSFFSLLMPSLEATDMGDFSFLPCVIGFLVGIFFLLVIDMILPHLHRFSDKPEGIKTKRVLSHSLMLFVAVVIHNIPEGAAAGVALLSSESETFLTFGATMAMLLGIAIQNFPEGAIIALPLRAEGMSRFKAFIFGTLSGAVEPIASLVVLLIGELIVPFMPYALSFAGGAMIYVVIEELIPEAAAGEHSNLSTIAFAIGFALMIVLDVLLG